MPRFRTFALLVTLAALAPRALPAQSPARAAAPASPAPPVPTLVVFITVDQMRPDYFARFAPQLTGGLARLYRGGAFFVNGFQEHANTETAPGHATTMSGREPYSTGILRNTLGVEDPEAPLLGGGGPGASPFRFRGSTLADWMRLRDPRSHALSVSRKDRGAILPIGRAPEEVYWYAPDSGRFTTSRWYHDTLPSFVQRFNARGFVQAMAGRQWTPLLDASAYPEPDSVPAEHQGRDFTFPHTLSADPRRAATDLVTFPWMDSLIARLALDGVDAMRLGAGPQTDLLAVSFSTTDAVGHRYGPESREQHDQILRLDRTLGLFFDSLYARVDSSRVIVALTADHGVAPVPDLHPERQGAASPTGGHVSLGTLARRVRADLLARGADSSAFTFDDAVLFVDRPALARARVNADSVIRAFAAEARKVPGVQRVDDVATFARADTTRDYVARRWLRAIPRDMPAVLAVTLVPYAVWGRGDAATHGTPHDYDARVPILFYGLPFKPGHYPQTARVVDMAPTLARVLGVTPTERLDGRVLVEALK